jgi:arginyl-tRNA synthetase
MKQELEQAVQAAVQELFAADVAVELTRPEEKFGDFATNVALQLAGKVGKPPREIAEALAAKLSELQQVLVAKTEVAGPGFLNFTLTDSALLKGAAATPSQSLAEQIIVTEYSDPNPFKVLHAGHLYTSVVGDAISNLLEAAGAVVHRTNFGGDVGMHVGKTLWAIVRELGGELPDKLTEIEPAQRSEWMAACYVRGNNAYEDDEHAKAEMVAYNKQVYAFHAQDDHESALAKIYWMCRQWSYDYFDEFYTRIGTHFERYYPESETAPIGLETVKAHIGDVFVESDGATIFKGEDYGLHTRVFINNQGLPTYEAKDVGLILKKKQNYDFDQSIVITGNEQQQYMAVVLKAIEQFAPELSAASRHLTHGIVKLSGGVKMSSRKGNILRAIDVLRFAAEANHEVTGKDDDRVVLGAVKYAFLKQRTGGDVIYDPDESVSLQGNSGPYLQYAHARARNILVKAGDQVPAEITDALQTDERSLVRQLSEYAETVDLATAELMPHHICTYLYELAQTFNRFYEKNRVIGDPRQALRLQLVTQYADTLKAGLDLLGIVAPDRM